MEEVDEGCLERRTAGACPLLVPPKRDPRIVNLIDGLSNGDRIHAERLLEMRPEHAVIYVSLQHRQESRAIKAELQDHRTEVRERMDAGFAAMTAAIEKAQQHWYSGAWKGIAAALATLAAAYGASKGGVTPP